MGKFVHRHEFREIYLANHCHQAAKEIRPDGGLWVCCVGEQDEARLSKATPKTNVVKSIAGKDDDCLGLCFRNPYEGAQACRNLVRSIHA